MTVMQCRASQRVGRQESVLGMARTKSASSALSIMTNMTAVTNGPRRTTARQKKKWMKAHCSITCGVIADNHKSCEVWAQSGECARNSGYMLQTCPQSCGC